MYYMIWKLISILAELDKLLIPAQFRLLTLGHVHFLDWLLHLLLTPLGYFGVIIQRVVTDEQEERTSLIWDWVDHDLMKADQLVEGIPNSITTDAEQLGKPTLSERVTFHTH